MADDVRENMALNADIQECRRQVEFWTTKLKGLQEQHRRATLFRRLQHDPKTTYYALSEEERTKDVVLAILEKDPHFFGECPWTVDGDVDREYRHGHARLPVKFSGDRDVVLKYARGEHYEEVYEEVDFPEDYWYEIPDFLSDDEEVVAVVCSKHWRSLVTASPRLQDDKAIVLSAITSNGWYSCNAIRFASERLRGDKDILLATVVNIEYDFSLLGELAPFPDVQCEKDVAMAVIKRLEAADPESYWDEDLTPLPHLSDHILDDQEIMLQFVRGCGRCLQWCSERLQADEEMVKVAVKKHPSSVEFSRGQVRRELMSNSEFMLSAIRDEEGGKLLTHAPYQMQHDRDAVLEAAANGLKHRDVPRHYQSDPEIALKCLLYGSEKLCDLDESVQITQSFALEAVGAIARIFEELPEELQEDEKVALQTLKRLKKYCLPPGILRRVFEKNPSLLNSRDVMLSLVGKDELSDMLVDIRALDILTRCPFIDDKEFILEACRKDDKVLRYASARLCADRDVVLRVLVMYKKRQRPCGGIGNWMAFPLAFVPEEFLLSNIDIVVKTIKVLHVDDVELFHRMMPSVVWTHRCVVLAWLKRKGVFFGRFYENPQSSFRGDRELVRMAVCADWNQFKYADPTLQADRRFVRSLVQIDGRALKFAQDELKRDNEILTMAIANTSMAVAVAFSDVDDFDFLVSFATDVRDKLDCYENVFVRELLRGIASTDQPDVAPADCCHLPMLDQGVETSTVFKRTIAQFLGVPLGKELQLLRKASANLVKCGY